mmetsp:Transcript_69417/g.160839  ORF Transcript_69417/g.160839 Transcript_69417/m.160839 type:complete len:216 (+) Transcript_69417:69-716(+)
MALVWMSSEIQSCSLLMLSSPSNLQLQDETPHLLQKEGMPSSCKCALRLSRFSASIWSTRSRSKAHSLIRWAGWTTPHLHRKTGACELIALILASILSSSAASGTKSVLFNKMRSAKASCSAASFWTPSGLTSSRVRTMCLASTTVQMPSSLYLTLTNSSTKNVCATGPGAASPVVSMSTPSNFEIFAHRLLSDFTRSPRTVQQTHPSISTISSS